MAFPTILFGPDSMPYSTDGMSAVRPIPGNTAASGGPMAQRYRFPLGQQLILQDGRKFRFGVAGGSTLVIGNVVCGPVATASQQNLAPAAGAVGDKLITLTTGASSAQNVFAEGYASISVTPGAGQIYKIGSHLLMTSGAGDVVNLAPGNVLRVAFTVGTTKVDLYQNCYDGLLQAPATTLASAVMGVALTAPLTRVGTWIQTHGMASVLTSGTLIAGTRAVTGVGAGAASPETATAATSKLQVTIGVTFYAAATTAWSGVFLTLDG